MQPIDPPGIFVATRYSRSAMAPFLGLSLAHSYALRGQMAARSVAIAVSCTISSILALCDFWFAVSFGKALSGKGDSAGRRLADVFCAALLDVRSMDAPSRGPSVQEWHRKALFPDARSMKWMNDGPSVQRIRLWESVYGKKEPPSFEDGSNVR